MLMRHPPIQAIYGLSHVCMWTKTITYGWNVLYMDEKHMIDSYWKCSPLVWVTGYVIWTHNSGWHLNKHICMDFDGGEIIWLHPNQFTSKDMILQFHAHMLACQWCRNYINRSHITDTHEFDRGEKNWDFVHIYIHDTCWKYSSLGWVMGYGPKHGKSEQEKWLGRWD